MVLPDRPTQIGQGPRSRLGTFVYHRGDFRNTVSITADQEAQNEPEKISSVIFRVTRVKWPLARPPPKEVILVDERCLMLYAS